MKPQIIPTSDGSKTLYLPEINEQYHSVNGARTESEYVFIKKGFHQHQEKSPVVFEVGFGTGLNALLTAIQAEKEQRKTTYFTIEKYPLDKTVIDQLNYGQLFSEQAKQWYEKIHTCPWNEMVEISPWFFMKKMKLDIITSSLAELAPIDIVYFDAFGPDKQPEMWTPEIFKKIYNQCSPESIFVTYSAKGEVRRQLSQTGFEMERLPGPPGKKQMLRGIKRIPIL